MFSALSARRLAIVALLVLSAGAPLRAQTISIQPTGTIDANAESVIFITGGLTAPRWATIGIQLAGTFTGTVAFEGSINASGYDSLRCTPIGSTTAVTSATAAGHWTCAAAGLSVVRVRSTAWTSGTLSVYITGNAAGGTSGGGGGSGSNAAASATGSAVPSDASYTGVNVGGNLRGVTGISLGSHFAPAVAIVDGSGNQITTFGGSGGTASNFGAAIPSAGTAIGISDGTNMVSPRGSDLDSGAGTENVPHVSIRVGASGGSIPLTAGSGTIAAGTLRFTIATDDEVNNSLDTLDNIVSGAGINVTQLGGAAIPMTTTQADNLATTLDGLNVTSFTYVYDGTTFDMLRGTAADGVLVNLGANNDVTATGAITPADNFANPSTAITVWSLNACFDGSAWDRCPSSLVTEAQEDENETAGGYGTYAMTVRRDTAASSAGTTGQNAYIGTDANGLLWGRFMDPCTALNPTTVAISVAADTAVISAGGGSTRTYICGGALVAAVAEIVNIWEGTGTACGTSSAALVGSTTEANGVSLAANGGLPILNTIRGIGTNVDVCIRLSGTNRVAGWLSFVQVAQ